LDELLHKEYLSCIHELEQDRAKSRNVMLAIDTTPQEAKSQYLNNQFSWMVKGTRKSLEARAYLFRHL
jgi:hypothetical protein